nr:MAG: site-specific DNA-methyltransferase [Candidatus Methanoperedens sp.]
MTDLRHSLKRCLKEVGKMPVQASLCAFSGEPPLISMIMNCFKDGAAHALAELYRTILSLRPETKESTIRGRLNESNGKLFKRVSRGVYIAIHGPATAVILEGDARELIKDIEPESVDAIYADTPYPWLNKHLEVGTTRKPEGKLSYDTCEIDQTLLMEMYRVLKSEKMGTGLNNQPITGGAHMFLFVPALTEDTWTHVNSLIKDAEAIGFVFNKLFLWDKVDIGMGYNGRNRYEGILFLSKGKRVMPFDLSIPDVLTVKRPDPAKSSHESEKPVGLYELLLRFSTTVGDVVLDLFAGSANIARAALPMGRHCILFEKKIEFIEA